MENRSTIFGMLFLLALPSTVTAALVVTESGQTVTVKSDRYAVTFDKTKGGTITRLGDRQVQQKDRADDYGLANDGRAQVTINKQGPEQVTVTVRAFYMKDEKKAPSELHVEYRYIFHTGSAVVGYYAVIEQNPVLSHADVSLLPAWKRLSVLDFGDQVGDAQPFGGERTQKRIFFQAGTRTAFRRVSRSDPPLRRADPPEHPHRRAPSDRRVQRQIQLDRRGRYVAGRRR